MVKCVESISIRLLVTHFHGYIHACTTPKKARREEESGWVREGGSE